MHSRSTSRVQLGLIKLSPQFRTPVPYPSHVSVSVPAAKVVPINRYPMEPEETVQASTEGFFAVSPAGTRKSLFTHSSYMKWRWISKHGYPSIRVVTVARPRTYTSLRRSTASTYENSSMAQIPRYAAALGRVEWVTLVCCVVLSSPLFWTPV